MCKTEDIRCQDERTTVPATPIPTNIMRLGLAFTASRTLLSAVELDLFSTLAGNPKTSEEIRQALNLNQRAMPDFVDALVALKVLEREGSGGTALYSNTLEAAAFLVRGSPGYMGATFEFCAVSLYGFFDRLTDALRTGAPQNEARDGGDVFEKLYEDDGKMAGFQNMLSAVGTPAHVKFAEVFDFSKYNSMVDIGGGLAQLSCAVAKNNPNVQCTTLDLVQIEEKVKKNVARNLQGLKQRVKVVSSDFFNDEFPSADVFTFSMVLHDFDLKTKKFLMRKAYDKLPEGGALVSIEMLIDDDHRTGLEALLMSLTMIVETKGGFDYSAKQFNEWATEIGFRQVRTIPLVHPIYAVVAYK